MRGTIGGKGDARWTQECELIALSSPHFEVIPESSHTLQNRDREQPEALRARLIEATVEAVAGGSAPRLCSSRSWP